MTRSTSRENPITQKISNDAKRVLIFKIFISILSRSF